MDIYDYKKRLEKVENNIRNSSISDKNKKIIFNFEKQMFIKELSMPRIERCISIIGIISEKLGKDLDCLEIEDIEEFLEWIQRRDIKDWTKHTYKQVFKTYLKKTGRTDLANQVVMKRVRTIFSAPYLSAWLDIHPNKLNPNSPFWIRFGNNGKTNGLKENTCEQLMLSPSP